MATPLNIPLALYAAIANGISQDPACPFKTFNIIRYDQLQGIQSPDKVNTGDGDYPQLRLRGPISGETDLFTGNETFGTYAAGGPCDWLETSKWVFELTLTSDLIRLQDVTDQSTLTLSSIRKLGPRLGLPYVTKVKVSFTERDVLDPDDGEMKRVETKMTVTVECQNEGETI